MGIPSYFSHIIRNHIKIIRALAFFKSVSNENVLDNLFMDCNSIIYDSVYGLQASDEAAKMNSTEFESRVIEMVIEKIRMYLRIICPSNFVYIAFDGVAPFAKMEQQRTRRYKSNYMNTRQPISGKWNTSAITPGTVFMDTLSKRIEHAFAHQERHFGVQRIIVSGSNFEGEGEHKIMDFMRSNGSFDQTVALYGLDADLIMLSMFHLKYYKNVYVFREAPEFIKNSIQVELGTSTADNLYFLDIDAFATRLLSEMDCVCYDKQRIYDYVFMCFILGNDFLPHFPAMNIRTQGIQALMDTYRLYIGSDPDRFLISRNGRIQWRNVSILIGEIAKRENEFIKNEYFARDKFDKYRYDEPKTDKERDDMLLNCPIIYRAEEKYICPQESGWEARYYKSLLPGVDKKELCNNYLEGLEWTFKYYSTGCADWKWKYNYHYPPLFKDLAAHIPHFETDFISSQNSAPVSPFAQLAYVLPSNQLSLLPEKMMRFLRTNYGELYPDSYDFQWAFCRYFWEAHPLLPEISVHLLEQWDTQFKMSTREPRFPRTPSSPSGQKMLHHLQ
jgi:5'-3' exonuclease